MNVTEIYKVLANAIIENLNVENWYKAQLHLEVIGTSVGFRGFYDDNERFDSPSSFTLAKSVLKLHEITTKGGNNKWNRAIFTLKPDNSFDMEFIWDKKLQDEIEKL